MYVKESFGCKTDRKEKTTNERVLFLLVFRNVKAGVGRE
jgi:hypothetical protein